MKNHNNANQQIKSMNFKDNYLIVYLETKSTQNGAKSNGHAA